MIKTLHLIYIPGLGDQSISNQLWAVRRWSKYGVEAELFQMKWSNTEAWEPKFERLLLRIDELLSEGKDVALVGASAGASAAINAFTARKDHIVGVVCIAGKINRPDAIGPRYRRENPAFVKSAEDCEIALTHLTSDDRSRILSRYAWVDETVAKADSQVAGATNQQLHSIGHAVTIGLQLVFGAKSFISFLKQQQKG